jgi:hypothetical protein
VVNKVPSPNRRARAAQFNRWAMSTRLGLVFLLLSAAAVAGEAGTKLHASFEVRSPDGKSPTFVFSEGYATSESPILITIPGRKLTNADRQYRVDLQKRWLSVNVPKGLEYRFRSLEKCGLKRPDEFAACDHYVFADPKAQREFHYYIYVGNWP